MQLLTSTVGRKIFMAITGQLMVLFVVVHLIGNSTIYLGWLNAYAEHLHSMPPIVWIFRLVMITLLGIHVLFGIQLTLENSTANPQKYAANKKLKATFASENMIWTGVLLLIFIVYHMLHFTARVTPDIVKSVDSVGRFDTLNMVVSSFQNGAVAFIYVAAMVVLFLHVSHGIQSFFQTMGWNNEKTLPMLSKLGKIVAVVFLIGYSSIPVLILSGILNK